MGEREDTNEAVVVDGEDVLLFGDQVTEAAAGGVLEGDAGGLGAEDAVDVVAVVELVVEAVGDPDRLAGVAVLDDDEVVWLEEGAPHLQEVQVADRRDHDVELVLEQGNARRRRRRQGRPAHHVRRSDLSFGRGERERERGGGGGEEESCGLAVSALPHL